MSQSLTVVVPCYNEENTIKQLITKVLEQEVVRELIVIDDASTDNSLKLIKEFRDKRLVYLENSVNLGKGASVKKGFEKATSEYILVQDADLEYSPEEYQRLLEPLESGYADVVFGSRFLTYGSRRALYFWHRVGNDFLTLLSNMFTNIDLTDMETCYKVMRTDIAKQIDIRENRFGLEPELTAKLAKMKLRIYEVGISYRGRTYLEGKKVTWKDGISAIRCIIKYNVFK
jgi:glycosyltransferase involved in cell wall biosynthesis